MLFIFKGALLLALTLSPRPSSGEGKNQSLVGEEASREIWERTQKRIMDTLNVIMKPMQKDIMRIVYKSNISDSCSIDLMRVVRGLRNMKPWALQMVDASGKPGAGLLSLSTTFLGEYNECLGIVAESDAMDRRVLFRGQYCLLLMNAHRPPRDAINEFHRNFYSKFKKVPNLNQILDGAELPMISNYFGFRLGTCTPSTCSKEDIERLLKSFAETFELKAKVLQCTVAEPKFTASKLEIASMGVLFCLVLLVIIGTCLDWKREASKLNFNNPCARIVLCFSLIANTRKIFNMEEPSKIPCLHGIRFISLSWVILGHTYFVLTFGFFSSIVEILKMNEEFFFQGVISGLVSMETFFFLGGLLLSYVVLTAVHVHKKPFNLRLYVVHRFLRLLPAYILTIICVFVLPLIVQGPFADSMKGDFMDPCYNNWWRNLLFINNFFPFSDMCILHTWYLSVDVQLYLFCLLILLPLMRWPKVGLVLNSAAVGMSVVAIGLVTYFNHYPVRHVSARSFSEMWDYVNDIYIAPYTYLGSYSIGIFVGYIIATRPKIILNPVVQALGWVFSICSTLTVVYSLYFWTHETPYFFSVIYASFYRLGWTLGIAWVVLMCFYGYGGWINGFLSWKCWIPLSRLTFTAYLFHPLVLIFFVGSLRQLMYPTHRMMAWLFIGTLVITYAVAYCAAILVESPFMALEKLLLGTNQKKKGISQNGAECANGKLADEKMFSVNNCAPVYSSNEHFSYKL